MKFGESKGNAGAGFSSGFYFPNRGGEIKSGECMLTNGKANPCETIVRITRALLPRNRQPKKGIEKGS
jgi:hypothetical protein